MQWESRKSNKMINESLGGLGNENAVVGRGKRNRSVQKWALDLLSTYTAIANIMGVTMKMRSDRD